MVSSEDFDLASRYFCRSYAGGGRPIGQLFEGRLGVRRLRDGISVSTADISALHSSNHSVVMPRSACLVLMLEGRSSDLGLSEDAPQILRRGEAALYSFSDDTLARSRYHAGQYGRSILLQLREDRDADDPIAEFIRDQTTQSRFRSIAQTPEIRNMGEALMAPLQPGVVGQLLYEGLALELLGRMIAPFLAAPDQKAPVALARLQQVRDRLHGQPDLNLSLRELARGAGMSVSALKLGFREAFGQPVISYLRNLRLDQARHGLRHEGWSVKAAAAHAGYGHPANFSAAYRRRFGLSPGEEGDSPPIGPVQS